jgi:hypothetical protein
MNRIKSCLVVVFKNELLLSSIHVNLLQIVIMRKCDGCKNHYKKKFIKECHNCKKKFCFSEYHDFYCVNESMVLNSRYIYKEIVEKKKGTGTLTKEVTRVIKS